MVVGLQSSWDLSVVRSVLGGCGWSSSPPGTWVSSPKERAVIGSPVVMVPAWYLCIRGGGWSCSRRSSCCGVVSCCPESDSIGRTVILVVV